MYYTEGILEFLATDQSKYKIRTGVEVLHNLKSPVSIICL